MLSVNEVMTILEEMDGELPVYFDSEIGTIPITRLEIVCTEPGAWTINDSKPFVKIG